MESIYCHGKWTIVSSFLRLLNKHRNSNYPVAQPVTVLDRRNSFTDIIASLAPSKKNVLRSSSGNDFKDCNDRKTR